MYVRLLKYIKSLENGKKLINFHKKVTLKVNKIWAKKLKQGLKKLRLADK